VSAPILAVREVVRTFGGLRAVDGASFDVAPGTITALIGPNGAGKSTLFNVVSGFLSAEGGSVQFEGRRIDRAPSHRIARRGLVRTFQVPRALTRMSVLDNVLLASGPRFCAHASCSSSSGSSSMPATTPASSRAASANCSTSRGC